MLAGTAGASNDDGNLPKHGAFESYDVCVEGAMRGTVRSRPTAGYFVVRQNGQFVEELLMSIVAGLYSASLLPSRFGR